ncbi:MAG: SPFH domain-containing protein [Candidatus Promineifilaceae bacterium]|jgi:regulator of protease activity HflC (stomatin/prohibitin superfamily)
MMGFVYFLIALLVTFVVFMLLDPLVRGLLRLFGVYDIVEEGTAHVYVLFGKVALVVEEPGLQLLWLKMGPKAFIIRWMGDRHVLDTRLDQRYQRSLPVNSEEGAPMGIGVWYEMRVNDPVAYLFKNVDPRGSLAANVSSATVRTLSNMPLEDMLETRHVMSRAVRSEVSPKSEQWGYQLGSVYIRKVHFRDANMIRQIEEKVVNRLRQVTSAILQDGANRVSLITSAAERKAAVEFARAEAMRPMIVGEALQKIAADPEVADALFQVLEMENLLKGDTRITLLPKENVMMKQFVGAETAVETIYDGDGHGG